MSRFVLISFIVFLAIATVSCELGQEVQEETGLVQGNPIEALIRAKRQWGCGGCDCGCNCATLAPGATMAPCDCGCGCGCGWGK